VIGDIRFMMQDAKSIGHGAWGIAHGAWYQGIKRFARLAYALFDTSPYNLLRANYC
jgi:glycyl-tRNA synthetase alpha subunit